MARDSTSIAGSLRDANESVNAETTSLAPSTTSEPYPSSLSPTTASLDGQTLRPQSEKSRSSTDKLASTTSIVAVTPRVPVGDVSALQPVNLAEDADFRVPNNPFAFSPGQLNKLLNPKSLEVFQALGGLQGLEKGLRTDVVAGLSLRETQLEGVVTFEEATNIKSTANKSKRLMAAIPEGSNDEIPKNQFQDRLRVFRDNRIPEKKADGVALLLWKAYKNDKILMLLTVAAVVSLALGFYETFSIGNGVEWIEGVAICVAIVIVTVGTAANDWQKDRYFRKLNRRKGDREIKGVRSGNTIMMSIFDVTVGDVLHLEPGDTIPADGVLISGHGIKCDESSATGESDQVKKVGGYDVWRRLSNGEPANPKMDPFLISGSKVLEGVGTYLVTSVGINSTFGRIMMSLNKESPRTPLQVKLDKLADWISALGACGAGLIFLVLLIRFLVGLPENFAPPAVKGSQFLNFLIVAITVIVVAIPEGLPLAITLALAFATTKMLKENNLVRELRACETMGNATVICSDKTGTLTQNKMTVVAGTLGLSGSFAQNLTPAADGAEPAESVQAVAKRAPEALKKLVTQSVVLNATAFEGLQDGKKTFIGSRTEVALLQFAHSYFDAQPNEERAKYKTVHLYPFDSSRKCMGIVVELESGGYRFLVKGAAELMLVPCTTVVSSTGNSGERPEQQDLSADGKAKLLQMIGDYASRSLRTIALVYKDFESWPPVGDKVRSDGWTPEFEDIFNNMAWIGVVGIQDPLRPEVPLAINKCHMAGIAVKMVTGDNITTATAIARECGIKTQDGIAMEGPEFRRLSDEEKDQVLPKLQVLARSSPEDKRILVERLRHLGEIVAVTGDGTNDGPALKAADVSFSMGISGTEVAREASSIILLDDNFSSIITAVAWGRAVNDAVAKFLQFQVTVNIVAVLLAFVTAAASTSNESVLTAVQLLWVNLIMDTFAALALATDPPTDKILDRMPTPRSAPLFTMTMWKMITGQALYQVVVTFILYFAGPKIFGYDTSIPEIDSQWDTVIFNTFVWMQIFNEFNSRRLDNKFNVFEGAHRNFWFLGINAIMVGGQIMIVFIGGRAFQITDIDGIQWAICIGCSVFCIPWGAVLRCIPDEHFAVVFNAVVGACTVILRPIGKGFSILFSPITWLFKTSFRAVKRFVSRLGAKKGAEDMASPLAIDEESRSPAAKEK